MLLLVDQLGTMILNKVVLLALAMFSLVAGSPGALRNKRKLDKKGQLVPNIPPLSVKRMKGEDVVEQYELEEDANYWGRILQENKGSLEMTPPPQPPTPPSTPTLAPIGREDCSADGICNPNCSDLTPDPDCDDDEKTDPKCTTISSDFENGDEGWTISGDAQGGGADPFWNDTSGNPGGHIFAVDDGDGRWWDFRAAAKYHGNLIGAYNNTLSFDLRMQYRGSFDETGFPRDVVITSANGSQIWFNTSYNPSLNWTSYTVDINEEAGWMLNDSTNTAGEAEILSVLSSVADLHIRGEFISGSDIGFLDNVVLVLTCPPN
jgi:hypothetical protein